MNNIDSFEQTENNADSRQQISLNEKKENDSEFKNRMLLVDFLRNLATSIESGNALEVQIEKALNFFISYKFQEQSIKENDFRNRRQTEEKEEFNQEEIMKFLFMGWYIYQCLSSNRNV